LYSKYDNIEESIVTDLHKIVNSNEQIQENSDESNSNESVNQFQRINLPQQRCSQIPTKKSRESIPYKVKFD